MDIAPTVDQCNDALSLFGHANRQLVMSRREILKPELKSEYSHLCNPSVPFTTELSGDDLSKAAREIEDSVKNNIQQGSRYHRPYGRGRPYRGRPRGRNWFSPYSISRPKGTYQAGGQTDPNNQIRRGGLRGTALRH